jgi:hypothetical protein
MNSHMDESAFDTHRDKIKQIAQSESPIIMCFRATVCFRAMHLNIIWVYSTPIQLTSRHTLPSVPQLVRCIDGLLEYDFQMTMKRFLGNDLLVLDIMGLLSPHVMIHRQCKIPHHPSVASFIAVE